MLSLRGSGICLLGAATTFWISWVLMPGVGVTDAAQIFQGVAAARTAVAWSVATQLASAVLYVPALVTIATLREPWVGRAVRWAVVLLLFGALASVADAILHLLAYAMTQPGLDTAPLLVVMRFMQGPGLLAIAPLILSFFIGGVWLSVALAQKKVVSPWNPRLYAIGIGAAVVGGILSKADVLPSRLVGLAALGFVSAAQAWIGIALWRRGQRSGNGH